MALTEGGSELIVNEEARLPSSVNPKQSKVKKLVPLNISTSRKRLLNDEDSKAELSRCENPSTFVANNRLWMLKFGDLESPSAKFRRIAEARDSISRSTPSAKQTLQKHGLVTNIDWSSLVQLSKTWIKNPFNMALLLWIACVAVSGAILFLVMTGMLNHSLPKKSDRDLWFEINNQILNALFTLMCLYQHPKRFHHLVMLLRWKRDDIAKLREIYCKNGGYKPHEWGHILLVVVLLHLNCFAQYALCGLNLGYKRTHRPAIGVAVCLSVAIAAPAIASLYCILSPLGRDYDDDDESDKIDQESRGTKDQGIPVRLQHERRKSIEKRFMFSSRCERRIVVDEPEWRGGLFDLWEDIRVGYLSMFCTFCVFGWNMERLGFGNMYVHLATFVLFCSAPFWIFNLASVNIENENVRSALGVSGVLLCVFGLLYGGFWRIQMRKRFNLPVDDRKSGGGSRWWLCFSSPDVVDCAKWLFCCWCSLAQEVRTADYYDVVENKFCRKEVGGDDDSRCSLPLSMTSVATYNDGNDDDNHANGLKPPFPVRVDCEDDVGSFKV